MRRAPAEPAGEVICATGVFGGVREDLDVGTYEKLELDGRRRRSTRGGSDEALLVDELAGREYESEDAGLEASSARESRPLNFLPLHTWRCMALVAELPTLRTEAASGSEDSLFIELDKA